MSPSSSWPLPLFPPVSSLSTCSVLPTSKLPPGDSPQGPAGRGSGSAHLQLSSRSKDPSSRPGGRRLSGGSAPCCRGSHSSFSRVVWPSPGAGGFRRAGCGGTALVGPPTEKGAAPAAAGPGRASAVVLEAGCVHSRPPTPRSEQGHPGIRQSTPTPPTAGGALAPVGPAEGGVCWEGRAPGPWRRRPAPTGRTGDHSLPGADNALGQPGPPRQEGAVPGANRPSSGQMQDAGNRRGLRKGLSGRRGPSRGLGPCTAPFSAARGAWRGRETTSQLSAHGHQITNKSQSPGFFPAQPRHPQGLGQPSPGAPAGAVQRWTQPEQRASCRGQLGVPAM